MSRTRFAPSPPVRVALVGAAARHGDLISALVARDVDIVALRTIPGRSGLEGVDGVVLDGDEQRRGGFGMLRQLRADPAVGELPVLLLHADRIPARLEFPDDLRLSVAANGATFAAELDRFLATLEGGVSWQRSRLEAVDHMVRGVAHDFNNILSVVTTLSDLLIRLRPEGDPDLEDLQEILGAARRGSEITSQLAAFARQRPGEASVVRPAEHLRSREKLIARFLSEDTELRWDLGADDFEVRVDPVLLDQAILPLIWSRRDALAGGGSLVIALRAREAPEDDTTGRYAAVTVTTEPGEGAPAPALPVPAAVVAAVGAMGGRVEASHRPGGGYRVEVLLPTAGGGGEPVDGGAVPTGSETILLVEDHTELRRGMRRALDHLGYRVVDVADGAEALALVTEGGVRPHLVLADVVLPSLSGPALRARLRESGVEAPVLFLTGYTHHPTLDHLRDTGVAVLAKPVPTPELARAIRTALDAVPDAPRGD